MQINWAQERNLDIQRVDADIWVRPPRTINDYQPRLDGFKLFQLREDASAQYQLLRNQIVSAGGLVTSAASLRQLSAAVGPGRSSTSFHYTGLAFDLATISGMHDPNIDPFIVTQNGKRWQVWARATNGSDQTLDAVVHTNGQISTQRIQAGVINFTQLANQYGFANIRFRSCFPHRYICAEWWHFQYEGSLTPGISQFGIELLSLRQYSLQKLRNNSSIWKNRTRIFKSRNRGWN